MPFGMLTLTILTCWYHQAGRPELDINTRRTIAPWYRHKRNVAVIDMLADFHPGPDNGHHRRPDPSPSKRSRPP